jgi:hypothetical protein
MKTIMLATAAVLAISAGRAYAGEGEGAVAGNTFFAELPGVIAQLPTQSSTALAHNQYRSSLPTMAFVTNSRSSGTWVFQPNPNQGANS